VQIKSEFYTRKRKGRVCAELPSSKSVPQGWVLSRTRERENNLPDKERSLTENTRAHTHTHTHTRESKVPIVAEAVRNHPVDNEPDGATPVAKLLKPWILRVKARHRVFHMLQPCTQILY
jgi:hypothetical protein